MKIRREGRMTTVTDYFAVDLGTKTAHVSRTRIDGHSPVILLCSVVHHRDSDAQSLTDEENVSLRREVLCWEETQ